MLLWAGYTALVSLQLPDALSAFLELAPGVLGIGLLVYLGFSWRGCYLLPAPLSRKGALALGVFLPLLIPILVTGHWVGWSWMPALVYAPVSAIGQELFFRGTLLPAMIRVLPGRPRLAVCLQAVLFALWHLPLALATAPLPGVIAVTVVTFLGGVIWGWQVHHDRTLYWAMAQHVLYLVLMSLFVWE
jgi:membrane protease YdiL (CAAX protease family)